MAAASTAATALAPRSARGVIFYSTGDPSYNTTAPTGALANSGWQWQGDWAGFSATPIATHYFIAAAHVGGGVGGTFTLNGTGYTTIPFQDNSTVVAIPGTDLVIWHVAGTLPTYAPVWDDSVDGSEVGNNLVVFGRGTERGSEVRLPDSPSGTLKGWNWGSDTRVRRWGENIVTGLADFATTGDQKLLYFDFDAGGPGSAGVNESALSSGDSSGGVFIKSGNQWKLAGVNYGVDGPFSYTETGPTFLAALFDAGGLWFRGGNSPFLVPDTDTDVPIGSYSSRIAASLDAIKPYLSPTWNVDANGVWSSASNWQAQIPGGGGTDTEANFRGAIGAARTVTLDSPQTVGFVYFDNTSSYTISGSPALTLSVSSGSAAVTVYSGSHAIATPIVLSSDTNIDVEPANSVLTLSGDMSGSGSLTKVGLGRADVKHVRTSGDLLVSSGTLRVLDNSTASGVSVVNSVNVSPGARLDLRDNKLIAHNSPVGSWNGSAYTGVSGLLASGRNIGNGNWGGSGIITSMSAAISGNFTTLGIARASDVLPATASSTANWAGQTITGSDTLVMYTYGGDANLDGKINIDDYLRIDNGIAARLTGWSNGDFNYDGKVNIDDYTQFIDANIGIQGSAFFTSGGVASDGVAGISAVPETNACAATVIALAASIAMSRRSRRNCCR